jgi:hypothetical protein
MGIVFTHVISKNVASNAAIRTPKVICAGANKIIAVTRAVRMTLHIRSKRDPDNVIADSSAAEIALATTNKTKKAH